MSFFPDLTPLIKKVEEFTLTQKETNSLLKELLQKK